ncbi:MAG: hypothetical protein KL787_10285 [Taibaiella sp.]|nr:hypothetical protein [Taibaiella sp.]
MKSANNLNCGLFKIWLLAFCILCLLPVSARDAAAAPYADSIAGAKSGAAPAEAVAGDGQQEEELYDLEDKGIVDSAQVTSRDFLDHNLAEKYNDKDYDYVSKEDKSLLDEFKEWLIRKIMQIFSLEETTRVGDWIGVVFYIIIGIVMALLLYFIIRSVVNKDGSWILKKKANTIDQVDADLGTAFEQGDFPALIRKAKDQKEYRVAVRYYFVWLLRHLDELHVITFRPEKPALDYRYEIKSKELSRQYAYAAYLFNYIWYGGFEINEKEFIMAEKTFNRLLEQ